jgi:hypothetical protein
MTTQHAVVSQFVQVTLYSPGGRRRAPLIENVLALAGEIG